MASILRSVLAVSVGLLAGVFLVFAGEMLGHRVYPPPPGLDVTEHEAIAESMKVIPTGALVILVAGWAIGTFAGAWIASRIAPRWKLGHGLIVGGLFLAATLANLTMIPHPAWVWVVGIAETLLAAYLGARLASRRFPPSPVLA